MKQKKNIILICIQKDLPLSYETVQKVYDITGSYDAIIELNDIALKYNKDIVRLALFLIDE